MNALLGRPAPQWRVAAFVCGGYVLALLIVQLSVGGVRRPKAFGIATAMAVLICGVLVGLTLILHHADPISGGRVAMLELGPDGRGLQTEDFAYIGQDNPDLSLAAARQSAFALPVDFDGKEPPTVIPLPFAVPGAGVHTADVRRIWRAQAPSSADISLLATGTFDEKGLTVDTNNSLPSLAQSPLLVWGNSALRMPDLAVGHSTTGLTAADLNSPGDFTYARGLVGQSDRLRAQLIENIFGAFTTMGGEGPEPHPAIVGWLDSDSLPPLMTPGPSSLNIVVSGQTMLRVPLVLRTSPVGSRVHIDGPFNRIARALNAANLPIDQYGDVVSNLGGSWVFEIHPPREVGQIKPIKATVSADLDAPQDTITVQAGQLAPHPGGVHAENEHAPILAKWENPLGHEQVTFDVGPNDLTPDGALVIRLEVEPTFLAVAGSGNLPPRWALNHLQISLDGDVTGPPAPLPIVSEFSDKPAPAPAPPKPKKPKKPKGQ